MKIYGLRAERGKLKYYDEHIHYTLDGTPNYVWRKVLDEICNYQSELSIKTPLEFVTSKCKFKDLDSHTWLKSDFMLPIFSKDLLQKFLDLNMVEHNTYEVVIRDKNKTDLMNNNFVAFYLKESFDCVDWEKTKLREINGKDVFDFQIAEYRDDIEYPPIFKIKGMTISNSHFTSESFKNKYSEFGIDGIQFEKPVG